MWQSAQDTYLESRVLSADPLELVRMLYQAAIQAVEDARRHLASRDIAARARAISKANTILTELTVSLDHERGGEVSRGLLRLYDYIGRQLIDANFRQADEPLVEVIGLLTTLAEGWKGVGAAATAEPEPQPEPRRAENPWETSLPQAPPPETVSSYGPRSWSL